MDDIILKIENVSKIYKLGQIGGTTLREEFQRWGAKMRGKEDPTRKIGAVQYSKGETFLALDNVSFEVKKGERVGIIGHNGAGKSTLLKLISRITAPSTGMIGLNGRIASMLEVGTGFHRELTGRENIYMNGAILGMTKKEIDSKIEDIIEFSELRQFIDTPVKRYSSGMYVKLAFSVAAHLDSEIMIMDEVLAVGDMAFQKKCLDKMNEVSRTRGNTILYVSHNMSTIRELCDRVIVLEHGKVTFNGGVEEGIETYLKASFQNELAIDYTNIPREKHRWTSKLKTAYTAFADEKNIFDAHEQLRILIKWVNEEDVSDLCLRIEFRTQDERTIGTSFLYDFYSGKKDEQGEICVSLDLGSFAPGRYRTKYTFFNKGAHGRIFDAEVVQGLSFRVMSDGEIQWDSKHWGNILLPELRQSSPEGDRT
ncbi:polysaccharide ABC transporter ATP-binding protein [uncultured Ruminococcus sp.]|uniref:ABC transporter ATP-binding protein n=1 Tax=uncultured Ruminococcus sp. TaxID=165186 RepID=UPI0025CDDE87|nr:polysaccharide ABC transporter ATP-binding protein [uncultured Ruminococcus sp.]